MKHFYLVAKAISPLSIRSDHGQDGSATTYAIPGTTLLGSFAAAHRMLRPKNDEEFAQFFLNEQISMPYLYPANFKVSPFNESNLPVIPLPKTAQSCKRFAGFKPLSDEQTTEKRHGIRDSLFDWAVFSLLDETKQPIPTLLSVLEKHKKCGECEQTMDHINGYYRCDDRSRPSKRMKTQITTRLQTRTGINRSWGVVEEGILYNREVFEEEMRFWGEIILPDELADTFMSFLEQAVKEDVIRVGTARTRGLGQITITMLETSDNLLGWETMRRRDRATLPKLDEPKKLRLPEAKREEIDNFEQRLRGFDEALCARIQEAGVEPPHSFYFAITLYSPAILCDEFLRYSKTLDAVMLARELDEETGTFTSIYQATEMQRITGWNELWGTPRPHDHALAMGSVFLFACKRSLDDKLLKALYTLEEAGLGRRHTEGFGRICISDLFHLEEKQI